MTTPWTPQSTERLIALWTEGCTAAEIARRLGGGASRCAVLGKIHRLGLKRKGDGAPARGRPEAAKPRPVRRPVRSAPAKPRRDPAAGGVETPADPTRSVLTVRAGECRWPYGHPGGPGFGLCGRPVGRGAFCPAHAAIGYQRRPLVAETLMDPSMRL